MYDNEHKFQKMFIMEQNNELISMLDAKHSIISIVKNMIKISATDTKDHLMGKVELITNEMLTNIQKYENNNKFAIGVNIINNTIFLYFLIKGKGLDYRMIIDRYKMLSSMDLENEIILNGLGFYNCIRNSDYFIITDIDNSKNFTKEIRFGFTLKDSTKETK